MLVRLDNRAEDWAKYRAEWLWGKDTWNLDWVDTREPRRVKGTAPKEWVGGPQHPNGQGCAPWQRLWEQ